MLSRKLALDFVTIRYTHYYYSIWFWFQLVRNSTKLLSKNVSFNCVTTTVDIKIHCRHKKIFHKRSQDWKFSIDMKVLCRHKKIIDHITVRQKLLLRHKKVVAQLFGGRGVFFLFFLCSSRDQFVYPSLSQHNPPFLYFATRCYWSYSRYPS